MKHMKKLWMLVALVAVLAVAILSVSGLTEGSIETQRDEHSFYELFPSLCTHEGGEEWQVTQAPEGTTDGVASHLCTICKTELGNVELPALRLNSASLSLTDSLCVKYKVKKTTLDCPVYSDPYVVFVMNNRQTVVTDYTEEEDYYVFSFANIAPHLMNDTIEATLHLNILGEAYSGNTQNYSVSTYCYRTLSTYSADEHAELRTLLVDLLNYGAASQTYVGYKTNDLVNANLTDAQRAWGTASDRTLTTHKDVNYVVRDDATVSYTGVGLSLRDSIAIRFKINAQDVTGLSARVISTLGVRNIPASQFEETTGGYYIYFDYLTAAQIGEAVYVTIYDGETPVSNTFSYSVESYAYSKQNDADEKLSALVLAMVRYGDAAKAYVERDLVAPEVPDGGWTENDKEGWTKPY